MGNELIPVAPACVCSSLQGKDQVQVDRPCCVFNEVQTRVLRKLQRNPEKLIWECGGNIPAVRYFSPSVNRAGKEKEMEKKKEQ